MENGNLNNQPGARPEDYEILIRRRGDNDYASYCPQLNFMIKGEGHEIVQMKMKYYIENHILALESSRPGPRGQEMLNQVSPNT